MFEYLFSFKTLSGTPLVEIEKNDTSYEFVLVIVDYRVCVLNTVLHRYKL